MLMRGLIVRLLTGAAWVARLTAVISGTRVFQ